jgi:hypothetical protein
MHLKKMGKAIERRFLYGSDFEDAGAEKKCLFFKCGSSRAVLRL